MKIKNISIQGFKSFVDRTRFTFPVGTSVIVGPNGCGKSNIVDAIRWVLGEHNARHLRGKLMEDLIFSGSESRKPTGMAEVTLTLLNDGGQAPARYANFTEIEVLRRLYRSGESEYYINKVPARLRDIVDLFTDTGIGTRAYSIIEQGQVGWLITARPEERRVIFEEAAGINKYKLKKDAALRKLDATRANLARVNDIASEVKRQLNSLNRQAKKAERYKAVKDELKELELHLSSLENKRIREEKAGIHERLEGIKDRDIELKTRINARQSETEKLNLDYLKEEAEFKKIKERALELERLIQAEERAVELLRMRGEELRRNEERLSREIEELKGRKGSLEAEAGGLKSSINEQAALLDQEEKKLAENDSLLSALLCDLNEKEELKKTEEAAILEVKDGVSDIRHSLRVCIKEEELLRIKQTKLRTENDETERLLESRVEPVEAMKERINDSLKRTRAMEAELNGANERLLVLDGEKEGKEKGLADLKQGWSRMGSRLAALEEMDKNLDGVKDGAQAIMRSGRNGGGIHGLIADVIEAAPGYEKAVEAVLGDRLQYVIVESQNEGMEAIDYLKTHASGRGSFIPIKDSRPPSYRNFEPSGETESNGTTKLISKVTVKNGYDTVLDYLLGDVLLVKDLPSAARIWRSNGVSRTFVTVDGEMIDPQGIITGGYSNGADGGILQKRREIKELEAQIGSVEEETARVEKEILSIDDETRSTKTLVEGSRETLHKEDMDRVNLESELKILKEEIARLGQKRDSLSSELLEARNELEDVTAKKISLTEETKELEKALKAREDGIRLSSDAASTLKSKKENLSELVTEIKVKVASIAERLEHLKNHLVEKERLKRDADVRIAEKGEEIQRVRKETVEKTEEVSVHKTRLEQTLRDKDVVNKEETLTEEAVSTLSGRIKAIESETNKLKEELSGVQEEKSGLSLKLKELDLGFGHLKEKIIEKYGTDIETFEASPEKAEELAKRPVEEIGARTDELRAKIGSMGEVSLSALEEYSELEGRHRFLLEQQDDLNRSMDSLHATIASINRTTRDRFRKTFEEINEKFRETFPRLFKGGRAELRLSGEGDVLESGIEIVAQPPGKRLQNMMLLSGGERALAATALIFSIFLIKPSPFCLLDEVDAPLDDVNIDRFNNFVKEMAEKSQFILISHNKRTMEMADTLFGITMEEPGISKTVSVNL
jgi:chromosome segregation protein